MSMIVLDLEQGTPEWHLARCGIPTTSMFSNIITPEGKPSQSQSPYMYQLLADWIAGHPVDVWKGNKYSEIGKQREPEGEAFYEFMTDNTIDPVGFIYRNEKKLVGSSTDGLIGANGVFEQKNPKGAVCVQYIEKDTMPKTYVPQVQGELWVTDREWCDFMVRHPEIGYRIWRVQRDEAYITLMAGMIQKFIDMMLVKREKLKHLRGNN